MFIKKDSSCEGGESERGRVGVCGGIFYFETVNAGLSGAYRRGSNLVDLFIW